MRYSSDTLAWWGIRVLLGSIALLVGGFFVLAVLDYPNQEELIGERNVRMTNTRLGMISQVIITMYQYEEKIVTSGTLEEIAATACINDKYFACPTGKTPKLELCTSYSGEAFEMSREHVSDTRLKIVIETRVHKAKYSWELRSTIRLDKGGNSTFEIVDVPELKERWFPTKIRE